jgi:hypothetical protein
MPTSPSGISPMRSRAAAGLVAMAALAACAPSRPAGPPAPLASPIDTLAIRAHTFFLADDMLLGRGTGTPGADLAALYIESQCRALGLRPLEGSYRQPVPLDEVTFLPASTRLAVDGQRFTWFEEFLVTGGTPAALRGFTGAAAIVGSADDVRQAGDRLPRLDGRVAVIAGAARPDVAAILARQGAVGIMQVVGDPEGYRAYAASRGRTMIMHRDTAVASSPHPDLPAVLVGPSVLPALRTPGAVIDLVVTFDRHPIRAENVACLLPGTDPARRDTVIAFAAHHDHLGVSVPDAAGDAIYNGFSDNAAGVAMLLSIAEALRQTPAGGLAYGTLFLFFTAEERGLFGSDYFVARPAWPLERIRAVINLDAGAPPARPWAWQVAGGEETPLGALVRDVAAEYGWGVTLSPARPISDYYPFARMGVPAVLLIPGSAPYQGLSADSSQALRRRWDRYHQPADAYHDDFPFSGLQRYAEFALRIAEALDTGSRRRPPPR